MQTQWCSEAHLEARESIWSVPPGLRALYFAQFTLFTLAGNGVLVWYEVFVNTADTPEQTVMAIIRSTGAVTVGAAGISLVIMEAPRIAMVVADYFTKRWLNPLKERLREEALAKEKLREEARAEGVAEGRAEGVAEGRAEMNTAWQTWNERRMAAEANGEPFNEPPPGAASGN